MSHPTPEQAQQLIEQHRRRSRTLLGLIVVMFGAAAFLYSISAGYRDSALFFVGLPTVLALAVILSRPARSLHGTAFKAVTVALLMCAVWLHEGAICVLMAAPLVYGIVHGIIGLAHLGQNRPRAYALLPLLVLAGLEGITPEARIQPDQTITVERVVAADVATVTTHVAHGPRPVVVRPLALHVLGMPTPASISGVSLRPGAQWIFCYHGDSHGPGGQLVAEVTESSAGHLGFRFVEDTSITHRWVGWRAAALDWRATADGRTSVTLTISFRRGLDPSWYFGPIEQFLMHDGGEYLLDSMDLR
jgi:hypothetical protein